MMENVKQCKVLNFDILHHLFIFLDNYVSAERLSKHRCNQREKLHLLGLVVKQLSLFFLSADVSKLSADG